MNGNLLIPFVVSLSNHERNQINQRFPRSLSGFGRVGCKVPGGKGYAGFVAPWDNPAATNLAKPAEKMASLGPIFAIDDQSPTGSECLLA